jgi:hypothetical protein
MEQVSRLETKAPARTSNRIYGLAFACICLPVFLLSFYASALVQEEVRLSLFIFAGLALCFSCSCSWLLLKKWEGQMKRAVCHLAELKSGHRPEVSFEQIDLMKNEMEKMRLGYEHQIDLLHSSVAKSKEQVLQLNLDMDKKLEQMRVAYLEFEDLRKEYNSLDEEYARYRQDVQGQLNQKQAILEEYQQTIAEQREVIEKKQRYIAKLEGKVRDLMYEIRGLLHLEDPLLESDTKTAYRPDVDKGKPYDFSMLLQRYIEIAEGFTGADHLGGRFLNATQPYSIDLRPLFDKLSHDPSKIVFVYSPHEERLLFISDGIREKLGIGPDRLIKDFSACLFRGERDWKEGMAQLEKGRSKILPLMLKNKQGQEVKFDSYMALVSKGPFASLIVGFWV